MKLKIISNFLKSNFPLGIILFVHLPFFVFGKASYIEILDNLNAEFIYNHLLAISDNIFNFNQFQEAVVHPFMPPFISIIMVLLQS